MKSVILALSLFSSVALAESTITGFVIKVYDGDTATVVTADHTVYKIRLAKIDAPELKQEYGKSAKACLADKILNQRVIVKLFEKDFYQRYVGEIYMNGLSINDLLVEEGCAWVYHAYNKDKNLELLEKEAILLKKGLWSQESPTAPWVWRKAKK
jgi:endonuclease YncB( thermonuclease family)